MTNVAGLSTRAMSLPEVLPALEATSGDSPPSTPLSEATCVNDQYLSPAQQLSQLKGKLRHADAERDTLKFQLFHARICYEAEAQSHQALRQGLEGLHHECVQLGAGYKSRYEECGRENERLQTRCTELSSDNDQLREHLRVTDELISCYKRLIEMSEGAHHQPLASNLSQGWPTLPPNDGPNHFGQISLPPLSHPLSLPPLSLNRQFVINPTSLRPVDDVDYGIGPSVDHSFGTDLVMSATASPFVELTQNRSLQPEQLLSPIQHNAPSFTKTDEEKGSVGKEDKPGKKRKSKLVSG